MKRRSSYGLTLIFALALGWGVSRDPVSSRLLQRAEVLSPANLSQHDSTQAPVSPVRGDVPLEDAKEAKTEPTIRDLKAELDRLSDEELKHVAQASGDEIRRMVATDPTGKFRSAADTREIGLALNRESAARLLLIDRSLEAARKKYL